MLIFACAFASSDDCMGRVDEQQRFIRRAHPQVLNTNYCDVVVTHAGAEACCTAATTIRQERCVWPGGARCTVSRVTSCLLYLIIGETLRNFGPVLDVPATMYAKLEYVDQLKELGRQLYKTFAIAQPSSSSASASASSSGSGSGSASTAATAKM